MAVIKNLEETRSLAESFLHKLHGGNNATVVGLSGELGAGKTAFTKYVAALLGVTEEITSPTFVIMKTYPLEGEKFDRLVHIDAYRLESAQELLTLGWKELIEDPKNLILIEWPENIRSILPGNIYMISFKTISEKERDIEFRSS